MRVSGLPLILLIAIPAFSAAQPVPPRVDSMATSTIYLQGTLLGGNKYVRNGREYAAGGSFGKLKAVMMEVPEAYELAGVGSRIVTHGRLLSLLGAAIGASTFFVHGERWELGISIGGFAVAGIGGAIQMKGRNRINEAVWIYNEATRMRAASEYDKRAGSAPQLFRVESDR